MELQHHHLTDTPLRRAEGSRLILSRPATDVESGRSEQQDSQTRFRVFIVDRDSMSSDLLATALSQDRKCSASAIAASDLIRRLATTAVDMVVIGADLGHNPVNGFELAAQVSRKYSSISIVMLLNRPTAASVIDAFRSGALGVFSRQQPVAEFLGCVEHVRKGFIWAAEQETAFLLQAFRCIPSPRLAMSHQSLPLTSRELEVVRCAAQGKTNKAIAAELNLSEHTVKNYLFRSFEKLGVSNRVELLLYLTSRDSASGAMRPDDAETDLVAVKTPA
jgi:two-component system, NarL family, nitrate/nitrite response regulator NarL